MASKRKRGGKFQYVFKNAGLLPRPAYKSFDDEVEGDLYAARMDALLSQGIVSDELVSGKPEPVTVKDLLRRYQQEAQVGDSDYPLLRSLIEQVGSTQLQGLTSNWADSWIHEMKVTRKIAPSTIRHYKGALSRAIRWGVRKFPGYLPLNPLDALPRGYANYSRHDVADSGVQRFDIERDRRLEVGEEQRIRLILSGGVPQGREVSVNLKWPAALNCIFDLALESAMRLREMHTLTRQQVDLPRRTIFLDKTKNGSKRQVPLTSVAVDSLKSYYEHVASASGGMAGFQFENDILLPWWNGSREKIAINRVSSRLSRVFIRTFKMAGCEGLRFHDLRHEATSRFFERTQLSDLEISKITGHKDIRMLQRYANLRASDLAQKMW
ncbi:MAG: site-specific integrase [Gammaproteobacteria bacterium]|nr:site-specific integrase [Gammaproteobacteria bacterium]MBT4607560.1 site-specific integrase [Thiotrichales bacterium]MBT4331423.1 site-specific integrase [Gammaproteobacteria bacterium]MBT4812753.1 site-specific integrase [Thiotrichales bacterium]MBT5370848.1 site-specific integrase [Gammaproteobacteria bacterium]